MSLFSLGQLVDDNRDILLKKKKMYFIKEDELTLQGPRNKLDRLWDRPVYTKKISDNNFKPPITNAALVIKQEARKAHLINKKDTHTSQQAKTPISITFCTQFQDMNQLIEVNKYNMLVNK